MRDRRQEDRKSICVGDSITEWVLDSVHGDFILEVPPMQDYIWEDPILQAASLES